MPYRIVAVAVVILALIHVAEACGCIETDVHEDVKKADVVVRGKVVDINDAYTDAITEMIQPAKRIVVIRVSRVWKGAIGETFEFAETAVSPLASCTPSWQVRSPSATMFWSLLSVLRLITNSSRWLVVILVG
jgi:hypothetical protein